jgi:hypothetical protein
MFITDPDLYDLLIPDPGSKGQKGLDPQHWFYTNISLNVFVTEQVQIP